MTPGGFAAMTRTIMDIADLCCAGKVVLTLEGGYDLYGERDSVKEVLKELAGLNKVNPTDLMGSVMQEMVDNVVARVKCSRSNLEEPLKSSCKSLSPQKSSIGEHGRSIRQMRRNQTSCPPETVGLPAFPD